MAAAGRRSASHRQAFILVAAALRVGYLPACALFACRYFFQQLISAVGWCHRNVSAGGASMVKELWEKGQEGPGLGQAQWQRPSGLGWSAWGSA